MGIYLRGVSYQREVVHRDRAIQPAAKGSGGGLVPEKNHKEALIRARPKNWKARHTSRDELNVLARS